MDGEGGGVGATPPSQLEPGFVGDGACNAEAKREHLLHVGRPSSLGTKRQPRNTIQK